MHCMGIEHLALPNFPAEVLWKCDCCSVFNITQRPVHTEHTHTPATKPYERVFVDTAGPFKSPTTGGAYYLMQFVDEAAKTGKTYLLRTKAANYYVFRDFLTFIDRQPGEFVILRSDNAAEFGSARMTELMRSLGVCRQWCNAYEKWQNYLAEQYIGIYKERARLFAATAGTPYFL